MAAPQFAPASRSAKSLLGGERKLSQPAYNPATAQQYQPGTIVQDNGPGSFSEALMKIMGTTPGPDRPGSLSTSNLQLGWAPQIGHIKTNAATAQRRRTTNPLLATPTSLKSKNPFVISQTPSADLFGLNIPT